MDVKELNDYLTKRGIRPSFHRIKILEYLFMNKTHPTVDDIYKDLINEIPTLSRTTIYNTLSLFVEKGIVSQLIIDEGEARYDLREKPHAHFRCIKCGRIFDIDFDCALFKEKFIDGNKIIETQVNIIGICKDCLEKEKKTSLTK